MPLSSLTLVITPSIAVLDLNCRDVKSPVMFSATKVLITESCNAFIQPNQPVCAAVSLMILAAG